MSNFAEAAAVDAMADKIAQLESQVAQLQSLLENERRATLGAMLGPLRAREIVLLYIGTGDSSGLVERLSRDFGPREVNEATRHLFVLNQAPCSDQKREEFRALFNNGMTKF